MEAVEKYDEGRTRTFLDKNVLNRPAQEVAGGSTEKLNPCCVEAEGEEGTQHKRGQSSSSAPPVADQNASSSVPEQRKPPKTAV